MKRKAPQFFTHTFNDRFNAVRGLGIPVKGAANEEKVDNFSTLESLLPNAVEEGDDLVFEERVPNADLSVEDNVLLREALNILEEPYRTAYLLRNGAGWQIESDDPDIPTIAEYFGKTPRTIRNWLAMAETQLKGWRNEREKDA